jgi:hypothetical protein
MLDEAKLDTAMARLRTWLLADISERIKREAKPLVGLEYAVTSCARTRRTGCWRGGQCFGTQPLWRSCDTIRPIIFGRRNAMERDLSYRPGDIKMEADVHLFFANTNKEHPPEDHFDRRVREREAEATKTKQVERAQKTAQEGTAWARSVNESLGNAELRLNQIDEWLLPNPNRERPSPLLDAIGQVIGAKRKALRDEIGALRAEVEAKLAETAERLKSTTGELPQVRHWKPETVAYIGQLFAFDGGLFQAKRDTATAPGGPDWTLCARSGEDGRDGHDGLCVRGPYDMADAYAARDVCEYGGEPFVALRAPETAGGCSRRAVAT